MSVIFTSSDLETSLGTSCHEVDSEPVAVCHRYEQVAFFFYHRCDLRQIRCSEPVQFFLQNRVGDAGEKEFVLVEAAQVEEIDAYLDTLASSPCEDVFLELIKSWFFNVYVLITNSSYLLVMLS